MSTDTDDDVGVVSSATAAGEPPMAPSSPVETVSTVLITANVGSIFEDPEQLVPQWHAEVLGYLAATKTQFVAMHFQEASCKQTR